MLLNALRLLAQGRPIFSDLDFVKGYDPSSFSQDEKTKWSL